MKTIMEVILEISEEVDTIKQVVMEIRRTRLAQFKDEWIDGQEVMQSLYISKRTLQTLRDQGKLPYSRINGKFYYKVADLETLLQSNYSHSKRTGYGNK